MDNLRYDLHSHSTCSDGELEPERLVELAASVGVDVLALTDHDSVAGIERAVEVARAYGLQLVPGVEISSRWAGLDIHVVGLNLDVSNVALRDRLDNQNQKRVERAHKIDRKLGKLGFGGVLEAVKAQVGDKPPGRPDFARVLISAGACRSFDEAFRKYLGQGKAAYAAIDWPTLEESVSWIHEAGGMAVLAHPGRYKMTRSKLSCLIKAFKQAGGDALEVVTSGQDKGKTEQLASFAQEYGLLASLGSDYHGPSMHWIKLGQIAALPKRCRPIWSEWNLGAWQ